MGSGASTDGGGNGISKMLRSSLKNNDAAAANAASGLTNSGKAAYSKDVRRASFIPSVLDSKAKSNKQDDEVSTLHADEALKVTIHNDASRRAFMKFLQKSATGHDHVLNYYFEIDDIKASKNESVHEKSKHLHARYLPFQTSAPEKLQPVWKYILETTQPVPEGNESDPEDAIAEVLEQCKTTQLYIVSQLSPILADFYTSDVYKEFENAKSHQEGALLRPSMGGPSPAAAPNASAQLPNNTYPKHFKKILVVDDSSVAVKVSMLALKKNGHEVKSAQNGRKCLEMCESEQFDVVLVDLFMPIMDGFETMTALKALKANAAAPGTTTSETAAKTADPAPAPAPQEGVSDNTAPVSEEGGGKRAMLVIAMSALWDKEMEDRAFVCGANGCIEKPFSVEKLSAVLVKFIPTNG